MARSDTRYSIYPAPKAIEILGASSPALNQAVECWAALLARATADNSRKFSWHPDQSPTHVTGKWEDMSALNPWGLLAEILRDKQFDPEFAKPGELLATAVEDGQRLEDVANHWFSSEFDGEEYAQALGREMSALVENLRGLQYHEAWAVIGAVQWYWAHHKEIDIKKDAWWTLSFRRKWHQANARKEVPRETTPTKRKKRSAAKE